MFKAIIVALAVVSGTQLIQGAAVELQNFERAFSHVNNIANFEEKISGLKDLVNMMKENDHLYSQEMLKVTFLLKKLIQEAQNDTELTKLEEIKQILPSSLQSLTCSKVKFYQTFLKGYLYADLKLLHDKDRRHTFADGKSNDLTTTWTFSPDQDYVRIINEFFNECFLCDYGRALTFVPAISGCGNTSKWAIELIHGSQSIKLRSPFHNQYLYVSDEFNSNKRVLKMAANPINSHWEVHCVN